MPVLFAATLFLSAFLLFLVQPMTGRLVLPLLGGSPAVWNTCMVFFQTLLLAGYAYAHAAPTLLGVRRQALVHAAILLLPLAVLPLGLPANWGTPSEGSPVLWLLGLLFVSVGLPFFVLSTSAPLLQCWLADTTHSSGRDPYYLYVASNAGSLLALLAYPLSLEPLLPLSRQCLWWSALYLAWLVLVVVCAVWFRRTPAPLPDLDSGTNSPVETITPARRCRWLLLGFVPSGLLLSVTTYLTADLAAVPLLWVPPLALYLLTFILAFSRRTFVGSKTLARQVPVIVPVLVLVLLSEGTEPVVLIVALHLFGLFWICLFCHAELARDRPSPRRLTGFYLWLSLGGALGGMFTGLLAPLLFGSVVEYPLLLVLACLLRPPAKTSSVRDSRLDLLLPAGLGVLTVGLVLVFQTVGLKPGPLSLAAMFALPAFCCYTFDRRPLRFGLGIGALLLASSLYGGMHGRTEARFRSFFGIHRVTIDPTGRFRLLIHGNTIHGQQSLDPEQRRVPLTYYHRTGPAGELFLALKGDPRLERVGLIRLGTGALSCYAAERQHWTFFEIDPVVIRLARDARLFSFLADCPAEIEIVEGDARLRLAHRANEQFGVLVVDAFSSDAIPMHLLTREALAVYRRHLKRDGLLLLNVSNRYLDLVPVLATLAAEAAPGMVALYQEDLALTPKETVQGKAPSIWVVLAPSDEALTAVRRAGNWRRLVPRPGYPLWTDDYCNLLRTLRREGR